MGKSVRKPNNVLGLITDFHRAMERWEKECLAQEPAAFWPLFVLSGCVTP